MQGWSPDFIPQLAQEAAQYVDAFVAVNGNAALQCARDLARKEGIFVGISAGATLAGALQIAATTAPGSTLLCMLPDTGERYLSTPLFADVAVEMTDEERAISRSTPGYRFDVRSASPSASSDPAQTTDAEANAAVDAMLADSNERVVMFALEWCEFCWSVRKMLDKYEIPYRAIELDSVAYQKNDLGGRIRAALKGRTASTTLPQIFLGGEFIGGCTELFDQCKGGALSRRLQERNIYYNPAIKADPYSFLPGWLHSR